MKRLSFLLCFGGLVLHLLSLSILAGQNLTPADIMEKYGKAVVLIATRKNNQEIGLGSGFIVKSDGVIVTNYHVIGGFYPAVVKTRSGDIYEDISVIDYNERQDIAILKIKAFDLPTVNLGNSNNVKIGERVVVIGNPHGFENTISDGLLSQIRDTEKGYFLHQISAPISPGSSGSPVFNQQGEVIGIATLSDTSGQNLNFSVPINYARGMINGPVKYSLKEFAVLKKAPSAVNEASQAENKDDIRALERINSFVLSFLGAWENISLGVRKTLQPLMPTFDLTKYSIDPILYQSDQVLKTTYQDLSELKAGGRDIQSLKNTLMSALSQAVEASGKQIQAFENRTYYSDGSSIPNPDGPKAIASQLRSRFHSAMTETRATVLICRPLQHT